MTGICEHCGKAFEWTTVSKSGKRRRFCSEYCRGEHASLSRRGQVSPLSGPCTPETAQKLLDKMRDLQGEGKLAALLQTLLTKPPGELLPDEAFRERFERGETRKQISRALGVTIGAVDYRFRRLRRANSR